MSSVANATARATGILVVASIAAVVACGRDPQESPLNDDAPELVGTVWQWEEFQDSADGEEASHIRVTDAESYTLMLGSNGRAEVRADCNRMSWAYTLEGSNLTFSIFGPSTLAHCGDESLDQRYAGRLANTATYVMTGGNLYLNLKFDAGNLVFAASQ